MNAVTCRHYLSALGISLWLDRPRGQPGSVGQDSTVQSHPDITNLLASAVVQRVDDHFSAKLLTLELAENTQNTLTQALLPVDCRQLLSAMLLSIGQDLSTAGYGSIDLMASLQSSPQPEKSEGCRGLLLINQSDITRWGIKIGQKYMLGELPCITCWHPAELLESPLKKRQAWAALQHFSCLL